MLLLTCLQLNAEKILPLQDFHPWNRKEMNSFLDFSHETYWFHCIVLRTMQPHINHLEQKTNIVPTQNNMVCQHCRNNPISEKQWQQIYETFIYSKHKKTSSTKSKPCTREIHQTPITTVIGKQSQLTNIPKTGLSNKQKSPYRATNTLLSRHAVAQKRSFLLQVPSLH